MNGYVVIDLNGFDGSTTVTIDGASDNAIEAVNSGKLCIVAGIAGVTPCACECSVDNGVVTIKTISKVITINNDVVSATNTSKTASKKI